MRLIAGNLKGRRLTPPKDQLSRPTADRAREALFSILSSRDAIPDGGLVLDCFAGTGALGLEALSRGAARATFMERHPAALSVLKANIDDLGVAATCTILKVDATKPPPAPHPCDLAFLDPPYNQGLVVPCLESVLRQGWLKPAATIVVEISATESIALPPAFVQQDERRYGAAKFLILIVDGGFAGGDDQFAEFP